MDDLGLKYSKCFVEGDKKMVRTKDYTSENTIHLTVKEIEALLLAQPEIISALKS